MAEAKLKNEDFRKLLNSTSSNASTKNSGSKSSHASHAFTHRKTAGAPGPVKKKIKKYNPKSVRIDGEEKQEDDIFDESQARLNEILKNYRDRAAERRKGLSAEETEIGRLINGSKVSSQAGSVLDSSAIEARKMQIQKSKYLGGDMEHTHLVKGLDYSLLNKVRTEITEQQIIEKEKILNDSTFVASENSQAGNKLARNLCKILFETKLPKRNELFARGRMAYLVELDEEESDVPSTLLRSVVESAIDQSNENINADNVLINKLSQVLAYLRTDVKKKKRGGFEREVMGSERPEIGNIFEGVDEYVPSKGGDRKKGGGRRQKEEDSASAQRKSYFSSSAGRGHDNRTEEKDYREKRNERKRDRDEEEERRKAMEKEESLQKKKKKLEEEDAYAELYPGGLGMIDAAGESDDDDFTQMDQGNRKPQIKRWDFESQEDYERYQSQREAHPRAAYQFGVKTSGGRKTRKNVAAANDRKIDRELDKINKILEKGVSKNIRY